MIYKILLISLLLISCAEKVEEGSVRIENPDNPNVFYYKGDDGTFSTYGESEADNRNVAKDQARAMLEANKEYLLFSECLDKSRTSEYFSDTSTSLKTSFLYKTTCVK